MLCGEQSLVKYEEAGAVAVTLRCRSWTCADCAEIRKRQLVQLAVAGNPTRFVTLTHSPTTGVSPADRAKRLARAWRVALARWRRLNPGKRHSYLAVFEATKRGEPHLHILVRGPFIAQAWLSSQMRELIGSPIVDIRKVDAAGKVAAYVGKYVGKAPHHFGTCKRYWYTRDWAPGEPDDDNEPGDRWMPDERKLSWIEQEWSARGTVTRTGKGEITVRWYETAAALAERIIGRGG